MGTGDPTCTICGYILPGHHPGCACGKSASFIQAWEPQVSEARITDDSKDELVRYLTEYLRDAVFAQRFADCMEMIRRKNADYTQGVEKKDRIAAFRRIGMDIDVPMTKVWAIFAQKHWGAVMKFVKDGQVESEPIDGRINDLINYFVLLGAIIHDKDGK